MHSFCQRQNEDIVAWLLQNQPTASLQHISFPHDTNTSTNAKSVTSIDQNKSTNTIKKSKHLMNAGNAASNNHPGRRKVTDTVHRHADTNITRGGNIDSNSHTDENIDENALTKGRESLLTSLRAGLGVPGIGRDALVREKVLRFDPVNTNTSGLFIAKFTKRGKEPESKAETNSV